MFNYILATLAWVLMLAYLALFLHPAKAYIVPGILGQMGLTEQSMAAAVILKIIPIILAVFLIVMVALPGRPGRRKYMGVLFVLGAFILTGYQTFLKAQPGGWPQTPPGVEVQVIAERPFSDRIQALGTTEANESTKLTTNVSETVKSIHFSEGQFVTKGTVIAELHDDEERASLTEAEKSYDRSAALARTSAISPARRDADRARLDITKAQLKDRQITAPFDGILGLRSISVGDIVNPGTVITTLDDVDPMKLEFSVPESYLSSVRSGMRIDARSEAYEGEIFTGLITAIDPRIDPITRSLRCKAEIPNPDGKLRAGMLLSTEIVRNVRRALAVSEEAIVSMGTQKSVMVAKPVKEGENRADITARPVVIGARMPGYVEIKEGLKLGELVVVNGVIKAHPGGQVEVVKTITIDDNMSRAIDNAPTDKKHELQQARQENEQAVSAPDILTSPRGDPELTPRGPDQSAPTLPLMPLSAPDTSVPELIVNPTSTGE